MLVTRPYTNWNPWQEMERMERQINRIFSDIESTVVSGHPKLNAWVKDDKAFVEAELPGYQAESIDISVNGRDLTIKGARKEKASEKTGDIRYHLRERHSGQFQRRLRLPFRVESADVEASFHNGLLTVTLPQVESDKPKKIAVTEKLN